MSLEHYCALSKTLEDLKADLMRSVDREAEADGQIKITSQVDLPSPGLTPEMRSWYLGKIAHLRVPAITELKNLAGSIHINGTTAIYPDYERDRVSFDKRRAIAVEIENYNRTHKEHIDTLRNVRSEHSNLRQSEGGRDAKVPNKILEWGFLLPVVLIPEAMLNYESFLKAPLIKSGVIALGMTLVVGLAIALAAYCWGLYVRRLHFYNRPTDKKRSSSGLPLVFGGLACAVFAFGMVASARYFVVTQQIDVANVIGSAPPNMFLSVASLLLGNIVCLVLGMIITFFLNDPNEDFQDKAETLKKLEKTDRSLRVDLDQAINKIAELAKQEQEKVNNRVATMRGESDFLDLERKAASLTAQDSKITSILQDYRGELASKLRERSRGKKPFRQTLFDIDKAHADAEYSVDEFRGVQISLSRYSE